jgi:hypothetical protein
VLYETGFKLKSAEERIDHLMKEMGELRMFATVSAQFQNEAEEERRNLVKSNFFSRNSDGREAERSRAILS